MSNDATTTVRASHVRSMIVPLLYALFLLPVLFLHRMFEEWDGVMQLFAGTQIVAGHGYVGWASHFWPPLYPILIGIGSRFMPGFAAAKAVSFLASVLLIRVTYDLSLEWFDSAETGLLAQTFLSLNILYVRLSLQAENHMLDSLFFVLALVLFLRSLRRQSITDFLLTGTACGLAASVRYTSYSLLPLVVCLPFALLPLRTATKAAAATAGGALVVMSFWLVQNARLNGSPFHTWQYMNVGAGISSMQDQQEQWWWSAQARFSSVLDILRSMPAAYAKNVLHNINKSASILMLLPGVLAPFVWPGVFLSLTSRTRITTMLFGFLAAYILLVSQAFVFDEVFLHWVVVMVVAASAFLWHLSQGLERHGSPLLRRFSTLALACLLLLSLGTTAWQIRTYLSDRSDNGQLIDHESVSAALKKHDGSLAQKYVMAVNPSRAYYAGSRFMMMPTYFTGTLAELVSYKVLSDRVIEAAPKYPAEWNRPELRADYLIYDASAKWYLPQFSFLLDPHSGQIPPSFRLIYQSEGVAVYEIEWMAAGQSRRPS